jgi:MFS family permease
MKGLVAALGVTQIIGYGSIYYAYPILVPAIAREFSVQESSVFAVLSLGLLLGGFAAPFFGRFIDRLGAPRLMLTGSVTVAVLMALLTVAPNFTTFAALALGIEAISFAVLYDAAFATLAQRRPEDTRRAITRLTLIAGFASTLFWPMTGWLVELWGWRGSYLFFAALHLFLAAPLHRWIAKGHREAVGAGKASVAKPPLISLSDAQAKRAFVLLGTGFALTGMAVSALGVHLVPMLAARDLGQAAYLVAMVMGPSQVLIRLVDAAFWPKVHPVWVAALSAFAVPLALIALLVPGPALLLGLIFAVLFGAGQGLTSIVRGSAPIALFGTVGIGQRLGRLAALRSTLGAMAPFLFALAQEHGGPGLALSLTLIAALGGLAATMALWLMIAPLSDQFTGSTSAK